MRRRLLLLVAAAALACCALPATADAFLFIIRTPPSLDRPPPGYRLSGRQALAVAERTAAVRAQRSRGRPRLVAHPYLINAHDWFIDYLRGRKEAVRVQLNGLTGRIESVVSGRQIDWPPIAFGNHGPRARRLHWALALAGLLFLLPFFDPRRPLRALHFDLLAILAFAIPFAPSEHGNIYLATPLIYPPLVYITVRLAVLALRRSRAPDERLTWMSTRVLAPALLGLLVLRYAYVLVDGVVNDVGYASVFGADSIIHGYPVYTSSGLSGHLDTYGPIAYLAYVPFTLLFPLKDLTRHNADAAVAAALTFDVLTVFLLFVLGRRMRPGPSGTTLGLLLAWGFAACPWTLFVLAGSSNDGLVALLLTLVLLVAASPLWRGLILALAAAAKFAPLILAALLARAGRERELRSVVVYGVALVGTIALTLWAFLPSGGLHTFWDSTIGFQFSRTSPFSIWGLHPGWKPLHPVVTALVALAAAAAFFYPAERDLPRLAAAGAALLFGAQLTTIHWYWFYIPWTLPFALVAFMSRSYATSVRNSGRSPERAVVSNTA